MLSSTRPGLREDAVQAELQARQDRGHPEGPAVRRHQQRQAGGL